MLTRRQALAMFASPVMTDHKYPIIDPHVHVWKHDPRYPWAKETARPPEKDATPEMLLELMRAKGWQLGGENSGHIICLDKHTTGDGIVSALQVLHAMRQLGRSLAELTADLVMYPQVLINVAVPRDFDWQKHHSIVKAQAAAEHSLNGRGRVLLRPSGTEPVLRVMVEGEPREAIESAAQSIAAAVRSAAS